MPIHYGRKSRKRTLYYTAIQYGTGSVLYWNNGHKKDTAIFYMRRCLDALPTDINEYTGTTEQTKAEARRDKGKLLRLIQKRYNQNINRVIID